MIAISHPLTAYLLAFALLPCAALAQKRANDPTGTSGIAGGESGPALHYVAIPVANIPNGEDYTIYDIGPSGQILWGVHELDGYVWVRGFQPQQNYYFWSPGWENPLAFNIGPPEPFVYSSQTFYFESCFKLMDGENAIWLTQVDAPTTNSQTQSANIMYRIHFSESGMSQSTLFDPTSVTGWSGVADGDVATSESGRILAIVENVLYNGLEPNHPEYPQFGRWVDVQSGGFNIMWNKKAKVRYHFSYTVPSISPDGNIVYWVDNGGTSSGYNTSADIGRTVNNQGVKWHLRNTIQFPEGNTVTLSGVRYVSSSPEGDFVALTTSDELWARRPDPNNPGEYLNAFDGPYQLGDLISDESITDLDIAKMNSHGMIAATGSQDGVEKLFLMIPMELVPNPIPVTSVVRAKLSLDFVSDRISTLNSMPNFSITIAGVPVHNIYQNPNDLHVFYFEPPESPDGQNGLHDLVIDGMIVDGEAYPTLTLVDYVEYTTDLVEGIEQFSDAIAVSIEEAKVKTEFENLTGENAANYYSYLIESQTNLGMYLMKAFIDGREISGQAEAALLSMQDSGDQSNIETLEGFGFNPWVNDASGDQIYYAMPAVAIESDIHTLSEIGSPATIKITRTGSLTSNLSVDLQVSGTATADDYTVKTDDDEEVTFPVLLPAFSQDVSFKIEAMNDAIAEGDETLELTISPSATYLIGDDSSVSLILND